MRAQGWRDDGRRRAFTNLVVFGLAFALLSSCGSRGPSEGKAVARINDRLVTLEEFEQQLGEASRQDESLRITRAGKQELLDRLVQKELATRINEMVQGIQGRALRVQGQAQEMLPLILECELSQERGCWELRAAMSLSRLWQGRGKREEARQRLREKAEQLSAAFAEAFRLDPPSPAAGPEKGAEASSGGGEHGRI